MCLSSSFRATLLCDSLWSELSNYVQKIWVIFAFQISKSWNLNTYHFNLNIRQFNRKWKKLHNFWTNYWNSDHSVVEKVEKSFAPSSLLTLSHISPKVSKGCKENLLVWFNQKLFNYFKVLWISVGTRPHWLDTRVIIKILTHSYYPRTFDCISLD